MNSIKRIWDRIYENTHVDDRSLSIWRVLIGLFLILFYTPIYTWIPEMPSTLYSPPSLSISSFFSHTPGYNFFLFSEIVLILCAMFITLGIKVRSACFVYVGLSIFCNSFKYSFGKIDHNILLLLAIIILSFSGWNRYNSLLKSTENKISNVMPFIGVLLSFAMFTAGFPKLLSWIDFNLNTSGFMHWYQSGYYRFERDKLLMSTVQYFPQIFTELIDYCAVLFEVSGLFFLLRSKKYWRIWLITAGIFHLSTTLFLNITFLTHSLVYLLFFNISAPKISDSLYKYFVILLSLITLTAILERITGYSSNFLLIPKQVDYKNFSLYFSVIVWTVYLFFTFTKTFPKRQQKRVTM